MTKFSPTSEFPFRLTAKLPAGGSADISGKAGPINAGDAAKTPFEAKVKVDNMDIVASGFIDPASGIAGLANFDGTLNSNGSVAKAVGTFTGNKLQFSPKGSPASKTVVIKHSVDVDLDQQSGNITQGDVEIGKAVAHLTGSFRSQGETEILNMKLNGPNMPVEELQAMLPALGVVLPSGSQLKGGTLSAHTEHRGTHRQAGHYRSGAPGRYKALGIRFRLEAGSAVGLHGESGLESRHQHSELQHHGTRSP